MNRLTVSEITSIGAVDEGDNPESRIMLFKRHPDRVDKQEPNMADTERIAELEKALAEANNEITKLTAEPPSDDELLKDVPEVIKARLDEQAAEIAKANERAEATEAELAKEREARIDADIAKVTEEHGALLGDDAAPMLKAIHGTDTYDWLTGRVEELSKIIAESDLLKEIGSSSGDTDPASQIDTLAKAKMAENADLTIQQARVLVRKERADLAAAERDGA